jgi:copper ion binding protein
MTVDTDFHTTLTVTGMTCQHCANAVTEELSALSGVLSVAVTLSTGSVTVQSDRELNNGEIAAAIDEAGYQIAD